MLVTHNHNDMTIASPLSGFDLTPYALTLRPGVTLDQWGNGLYFLATIERSSQWWLGDLWILGEAKWGESAAQYASKYANGTIRNAAVVCRRFVPAFRQEYADALDADTLSFAHFSYLTKLNDETQSRCWLDKAIEHEWSAARLGDELLGETGGRKTFSLSMSDMSTNAAKLAAKLPAAKVRELIEELQKQLGEQG